MKILVQWTQKNPESWITLDSKDWASLAKKPEPTGAELVDGALPTDDPGWIWAVNCQGVIFAGFDHYAVEDLPENACCIIGWNDDPEDFKSDSFHAIAVTFFPLVPDAKLGGATNTCQLREIYVGPGMKERFDFPQENTTLHSWEEFVKPAEEITRHGIMVFDAEAQKHRQAQEFTSWREWGEEGSIETQRDLGKYAPSEHTRTWYLRSAGRATGVHAATNENALELGTDSEVAESAGFKGAALAFIFTTPPGVPSSADWPSGTYRCQLDVHAAPSSISYGLRTISTASGHFARVNSGLTADLETAQQSQAAFTGTGLKLASVSWNPAAGSASDRLECAVAMNQSILCPGANFTLGLNHADTFADGPWPNIGDSGIGLDFSRLIPAEGLGDAGLGAESSSLVVAFQSADAGIGLEREADPIAMLQTIDAGLGFESAPSLVVARQSADGGIGLEREADPKEPWLLATLQSADAGIGLESASASDPAPVVVREQEDLTAFLRRRRIH